MPGGRLTSQGRQHIAAALAEGLTYTEIGRRLQWPPSTIMREVARNGGSDNYEAERAQRATKHRARRSKKAQLLAAPLSLDSGHGRDPQAVQSFTESFTASSFGRACLEWRPECWSACT